MQRRSNKDESTWRFRNRGRTGSARAGRWRVVPALEQFEDRTLLSLSIGTNFAASSIGQQRRLHPARYPGRAPGPTQLVETINNSFSIFSKTGGLVSRTSLDSFFNTALAAGGGGTVTSYSYDPRILYDAGSQASSSRATTTPTRRTASSSRSPTRPTRRPASRPGRSTPTRPGSNGWTSP